MRYTQADLEAAAAEAAALIHDAHGLWPTLELRDEGAALVAYLEGARYAALAWADLEDDEDDLDDED
ncbi:hypothetical protein KKF91_17575, partial [Myxococcota bacterium]|nr:hypothetical protein [Myxococcota bacterium]